MTTAAGLIRVVIEEQRQVLRAADQGDDMIGRIGAVSRAAANALRYGGLQDLADAIERASVAALSERNAGHSAVCSRSDAGIAARQIRRPSLPMLPWFQDLRMRRWRRQSARRAAPFAWTRGRSMHWSIWRGS